MANQTIVLLYSVIVSERDVENIDMHSYDILIGFSFLMLPMYSYYISQNYLNNKIRQIGKN